MTLERGQFNACLAPEDQENLPFGDEIGDYNKTAQVLAVESADTYLVGPRNSGWGGDWVCGIPSQTPVHLIEDESGDRWFLSWAYVDGEESSRDLWLEPGAELNVSWSFSYGEVPNHLVLRRDGRLLAAVVRDTDVDFALPDASVSLHRDHEATVHESYCRIWSPGEFLFDGDVPVVVPHGESRAVSINDEAYQFVAVDGVVWVRSDCTSEDNPHQSWALFADDASFY